MHNLLENIREHSARTIIFVLVIICGLTLFLAFSHDTYIRIVMLGVVTVAYIVWGLVHHYTKKDLTLMKAIEYITVALFAAIGIGAVMGWGIQ